VAQFSVSEVAQFSMSVDNNQQWAIIGPSTFRFKYPSGATLNKSLLSISLSISNSGCFFIYSCTAVLGCCPHPRGWRKVKLQDISPQRCKNNTTAANGDQVCIGIEPRKRTLMSVVRIQGRCHTLKAIGIAAGSE
jgi:hypothetical protein